MTARPQRSTAIDTARGIAICLVAVFHMTRAQVTAHHLEPSYGLRFADSFAYGFHVQIFFLVSGYFTYNRIVSSADLARRSLNLYYPYLIYAYLTGFILVALARGGSGEVTPHDLGWIPLVAIQHYWFILYLIIALALALIVGRRVEATAVILLVIAIGVAPLIAWNATGPYALGKVAYWLAFFFVGAALRKRGWLPRVSAGWCLLALMVSLMAVAWSLATGFYVREPAMFPVSLAMCYLLYCVSNWLDHPALARLGALSLVIYLTHVIIGSGTRVILGHAWHSAPVLLVLVITIAAAIIGPLVLHRVVEQLGLSQLFGFKPLLAEPRPHAARALEA